MPIASAGNAIEMILRTNVNSAASHGGGGIAKFAQVVLRDLFVPLRRGPKDRGNTLVVGGHQVSID